MFPLIVAWAMIGFGALSALLSFVETDGVTVARRVIGGAILAVFGALLLFARAAFIPRE